MRDLNHLIGECPKLPKDKNQRVFLGGSWSDSGAEDDEKAKDDTCLVDQASSEIHQTHHVLIIGTSQSRQHDKSEPVSYYLTD
ncbi:hypothetical protein Tco_1332303 [Tanacetum coccineum]